MSHFVAVNIIRKLKIWFLVDFCFVLKTISAAHSVVSHELTWCERWE